MTDFETAYIECALWSSTDDDGEPMDSTYSVDDLAPETVESMVADCQDFQRLCSPDDLALQSDEQNGHDFWLTRNRHGAGFWDRGLGEAGTRLTENAHSYGSSDLYVGDDGKVYVQ